MKNFHKTVATILAEISSLIALGAAYYMYPALDLSGWTAFIVYLVLCSITIFLFFRIFFWCLVSIVAMATSRYHDAPKA